MKRMAGSSCAVFEDAFLDIPRHEDDTKGGISNAETREELRPTSARQHHVGHQHVDRTDLRQQRFGLLGCSRLEHAVAGALENHAREVADGFFVLDDEH